MAETTEAKRAQAVIDMQKKIEILKTELETDKRQFGVLFDNYKTLQAELDKAKAT